MKTTEHRVPSNGVTLSVVEHSPAGTDRESVVLVHGYPDDQSVWRPLVAALADEDLHLVTYDVRGAGRSEVPADVSGYRTERLVDDLVAVLDAVLPEGRRAHLVGHDWGSVQLWDGVAAERTDPRLHGRIASFTSISGPSLDHLAWLSRHSDGRRGALLRQSLHSWYVYAFQVPVLPDLVWRGAGAVIGRRGVNGAHGLNLYRANVLRRMRRPDELRVDVPVLVVHPRRDPFLTSVVLEDLDQHCRDVRVVEVDAGHWVIRTHAEEIAALVREQVRAHTR
jgi:pimeloyl-ACP methyl ester carboxylesterase